MDQYLIDKFFEDEDEDEGEETLINYMAKQSGEFHYTGLVYGADEFTATGPEISQMLVELGDTSTMIDHPTTGTGSSKGFYTQSFGDIFLHPDGELVFTPV